MSRAMFVLDDEEYLPFVEQKPDYWQIYARQVNTETKIFNGSHEVIAPSGAWIFFKYKPFFSLHMHYMVDQLFRKTFTIEDAHDARIKSN
jgi:hypothetical protein